MPVILASSSPRRKELLTLAGIDFVIDSPRCEETLPKNISPEDGAVYLSLKKAEEISERHPCGIVLAADTVVSLSGEILGKPKQAEECFSMLRSLSGKTHSVFTGVTIKKGEKVHSFVSCTRVEFYELTDEEIYSYIETGDSFDKAGGYGIQSGGYILVKKIDGDYFNVVGLPLARTVRELKKFLNKQESKIRN